MTLKSEDYRTGPKAIVGVNTSVTSYRIGERFYCQIASLDPGATIARAEGSTRDEAEELASRKAAKRLSRTR